MRGFVSLSLVVIIGCSVLAGLLYVQTRRVESAKAELATCAEKYESALKSIEKQNKAVSTLKADSEKAIKRARIASEQARKGQVATLSEIARLRASKGQPAVCEAADGVKTVREGLKP